MSYLGNRILWLLAEWQGWFGPRLVNVPPRTLPHMMLKNKRIIKNIDIDSGLWRKEKHLSA